jgi:hypothetical protein
MSDHTSALSKHPSLHSNRSRRRSFLTVPNASILGVAQFMLLYGTSGIFSCYMAAVIPTLFFDMPSHPAYGSSGATCGLLGVRLPFLSIQVQPETLANPCLRRYPSSFHRLDDRSLPLIQFLACAMPHDKFIALFGFIGVTGLQFLGATALVSSSRSSRLCILPYSFSSSLSAKYPPPPSPSLLFPSYRSRVLV